MAKNIIIFSDGTGQAGGLRPDQRLSNVYKLYRACRNGPDNSVNPRDQIAFYDAGLGSTEIDGSAWTQPFTLARKYLSSALGTGFTRNVADCYEAILKVYEPGDRIYLFGFSRGAYTVRSVAGVMNLCGVPTLDKDGKPIPREGKALRRIADEAVHSVYEHGAGHPREKFFDEREELARRFRTAYGTQDDKEKNVRGNIVPYFIGVFDTVAALGAAGIIRFAILMVATILALTLVAVVAALLYSQGLKFWWSFLCVAAVIGLAMLLYDRHRRKKVIRDYPVVGQKRSHLAGWRFEHYDRFLDQRVRYARHAQAIDESRHSFDRVGWGQKEDAKNAPKDWLIQMWFAGNHSDIGGSYPETESRLSDIALQWMLREATRIPFPIKVDRSKLRLFPDPSGIQHCEVSRMRELYPSWVPEKWRFSWHEKSRMDITISACHASVLKRIRLGSIYKHGKYEPYRPYILRNDPELVKFYTKPNP